MHAACQLSISPGRSPAGYACPDEQADPAASTPLHGNVGELSFLLLGGGIGLAAGISPGPVLTLVLSETLRHGWLRGAAVAAGPLLADGPIIVFALIFLR